MTSLQKDILEIARKEKKHCTADDVFKIAKSKGVNVSLASVYRILGKLADEGYLRRISNIKQGEDVFDSYIDDHEHLVCSKCGKITDIKIKDLKKKLERYTNVSIESFDLCMKYVCDDCKSHNF